MLVPGLSGNEISAHLFPATQLAVPRWAIKLHSRLWDSKGATLRAESPISGGIVTLAQMRRIMQYYRRPVWGVACPPALSYSFHATSNTSTGVLLPFTIKGGKTLRLKPSPNSLAVESEIRIWPAEAFDANREAMFTVLPMTV
jgi:hypothetical protein